MGAKASILFIAGIILGLKIGLSSSPAFAQESGGGGSKENLDLPVDAAGREEEEEAPEIVIFYGQQFEGDGIFFCLDRSETMSQGRRWKTCQKEVVKSILQFSEKVQFGLVFFDATLVKFPSTGRPAEATPTMKAAAQAMVMSMHIGSGTCSKEALLAALQFANLATVKRRIIFYLSDGGQTCRGADPGQYGKQCLSEVRARNTSGVKINSICVGGPTPEDESWMKTLAAQNDGQYTRVVN